MKGKIVNADDDPPRTHDPATCQTCRRKRSRGGEHAMATPKQGQGHKQPSIAKPVKVGKGHDLGRPSGVPAPKKNPGHEHEGPKY